MPFFPRSLLVAVLLLAASAILPPSASAFIENLARDFKPVSGVVIMPAKGEFLIDLDAKSNVAIGDLFTVMQPGEKVVHPVTKEVVGTIDEVKAILQVTRVKSGYSYAKPVGAAPEINAKDAIRRFENLPAIFWDYTGEGEAVYAQVKQALPTLEWQEYAATQATKPENPAAAVGFQGLTFVLKPGKLEVRDPAFTVLRAYAVGGAAAPATATIAPAAGIPVAAAPSVSAPAMMPAPTGAAIIAAPAPTGSSVVGDFSPAIVRQNLAEAERGVWVSPAVKEPLVGVEVGELDGDGKLETALLYAHRIDITRFADGASETIAQVDLGKGRKALAIDGADLNGDGQLELYITAAFDDRLSSMIVSAGADGYQVRKTNINYYFRNVDLPGEGVVLLAQGMGDEHQDFAGPIFRVQGNGNDIQQGAKVEVPNPIRLYSFSPLTANGSGGDSIAYLSHLDNLQIFSASGEKLWEGSERMGGSEEFITRVDPTKRPQDGDNTRDAYLQARLGRGDAGEILIPVNEGDWFRARGKTFRKSKLTAMVWNGQELLEAWHTREQNGYMADFRLADIDNDGQKEVVMAINGASTGLLGARRSSLYVFEMQ
ncbi:FG-GAP repeat domain-containing protein [Desulfuromonas acetexigens]|uniref:VCBS repeat-containing protein n=1 Tax=Trichloromonas acetexigens TaxID=38815 RepID=A0A550JGA0_9BACT|nr:VCBS repeat-containing protein [Desulfuromonas acetexigens]TRO82230.1 VCBS repeat-containing protein [Desulfuromonas acetexigens]